MFWCENVSVGIILYVYLLICSLYLYVWISVYLADVNWKGCTYLMYFYAVNGFYSLGDLRWIPNLFLCKYLWFALDSEYMYKDCSWLILLLLCQFDFY